MRITRALRDAPRSSTLQIQNFGEQAAVDFAQTGVSVQRSVNRTLRENNVIMLG